MAEGTLHYLCSRCGRWDADQSRLRCTVCGRHNQMVPVQVTVEPSGQIALTVDEERATQQGLMAEAG